MTPGTTTWPESCFHVSPSLCVDLASHATHNGILRVTDGDLSTKIAEYDPSVSYVCKGLLHEGSNNGILRVNDGDLLSKIVKYGPSVVFGLLGVTT